MMNDENLKIFENDENHTLLLQIHDKRIQKYFPTQISQWIPDGHTEF